MTCLKLQGAIYSLVSHTLLLFQHCIGCCQSKIDWFSRNTWPTVTETRAIAVQYFFPPQTIFFSPDFSIIRLQIWVFLRGCYAIKYYMFLIAIDLHFFTTQKVSPRPHQFSSTSLFFYGVLCASSNANEQH